MSEAVWKTRVKKASRAAVVTIFNNSPNTLTREPLAPPLHGEYALSPPEQIAPRAEAMFALVSKGFMIGTEAMVAYRDAERPHLGQMLFHVDAPYVGSNKALCTPPPRAYRVKSTDSGKGNLFEAQFEVSYNAEDDVLSRKTSMRSATSSCSDLMDSNGADDLGASVLSPRVEIESDDWKIELKDAARSVLVAVNNRTSSTLVRQSLALRHGIWRRPPPERIPAGRVIEFGSESDGVMIGTEGRVVYASEDDENSRVVLLWDNPFVGKPDFAARVSGTINAFKYANGGNSAEIVFDLQTDEGEGKPVFGATYSEVVQAHDGAILPPLLSQIVEHLIANGSGAANRGLFTGVPSFAELRELRAAATLGRPLELARFSPASLGHALRSFLLELADAPLAPLLRAHAGHGEPGAAGTPAARRLLSALLGLLAAVGARDAAAAGGGEPADAGALSSHELAVLFAPVFAPAAAAGGGEARMDDALRELRENCGVLQMLIDKRMYRPPPPPKEAPQPPEQARSSRSRRKASREPDERDGDDDQTPKSSSSSSSSSRGQDKQSIEKDDKEEQSKEKDDKDKQSKEREKSKSKDH